MHFTPLVLSLCCEFFIFISWQKAFEYFIPSKSSLTESTMWCYFMRNFVWISHQNSFAEFFSRFLAIVNTNYPTTVVEKLIKLYQTCRNSTTLFQLDWLPSQLRQNYRMPTQLVIGSPFMRFQRRRENFWQSHVKFMRHIHCCCSSREWNPTS